MVVKPNGNGYAVFTGFESDVILNGGQAKAHARWFGSPFESDVILNGGQATARLSGACTAFESDVILNGGQASPAS